MKLFLSLSIAFITLGHVHAQRFTFAPIISSSTESSQRIIRIDSLDSMAQDSLSMDSVDTPSISLPDTIDLPFWDDFSYGTGTVSQSLWIMDNSVLVYNTLGIKPPSIGVAVFDGLKSNGNLHASTEPKTSQKTDSLLSKPINLDGLNESDRVVFSFYIQHQGLGDKIEDDDSLSLQFLDSMSVWRYINFNLRKSTVPQDSFAYFNIPIDDIYLHAGFRFKFQSHGSGAGLLDVWCLDYVELDKNRTLSDLPSSKDLAVASVPTPFFTNFSNVPRDVLVQSSNPLFNRSETLVHNLDLDGAGVRRSDEISYVYQYINNKDTEDTITIDKNPPAIERPNSVTGILPLEFLSFPSSRLDYTSIASRVNQGPLSIKVQCALNTGDASTSGRTSNDTSSIVIQIDSVLSYDDGSAEIASGLSTTGELLYEFELPEGVVDTLTGIMIQFPFAFTDKATNFIDLIVWEGESAPENQLFKVRNNFIRRVNEVNQFSYYTLVRRPVTGKFYIGYEQETNAFLGIGTDRNSQLGSSKIWTRLSGETNFTKEPDFGGSLMIRPIFSVSTADPLSVSRIDDEKLFNFYPHPNHTNIFKTTLTYDKMTIFSSDGSPVRYYNDFKRTLDLSDFKSGVYFAKLYINDKVVTRKIIIL